MESKALFSKLLTNTKNNHVKKYIQIQMNKASLNEANTSKHYRNAETLIKLGEQSVKLHVWTNSNDSLFTQFLVYEIHLCSCAEVIQKRTSRKRSCVGRFRPPKSTWD